MPPLPLLAAAHRIPSRRPVPKRRLLPQQRTTRTTTTVRFAWDHNDNNNENHDEDHVLTSSPSQHAGVDRTQPQYPQVQQRRLIGTMDDRIQQFTFLAAFLALAVGTYTCIQLWEQVGIPWLGDEFFSQIQQTIFPIVFGSIFAIVGICHFVFVTNFARIVPPYGTWGGLWMVPAPFHQSMRISYEEYHSYWTGIAEFVGGLWLLSAGLGWTTTTTTADVPATLLFLLTIAITPANLYMLTHDVSPGGNVPQLSYPVGHIARFILQCGLLSNFWIMMHPVSSSL
jgi:uncharacterized membrane protein